TAYALTLSGLTVTPLTPQGAPPPQIASAAGSADLRPGSFLIINGSNLASDAAATQLPTPTLLGGSCVTLSDMAIPLLKTSAGQITAQVPGALRPGTYMAQVRSLAIGQQSQAITITIKQ